MPKLSSAQKTTLAAERKRSVNQPVKKGIKTVVTRSEAAIAAGEQAGGAEEVKKALKALDRGVTQGILHRNSAARRKSRLMKKYNAAVAAAAPAAETKQG